MGNITGYSGISTKTRAMSGKLLSVTDYEILASADSISEAIRQLKKHVAYTKLFERIEDSELHRGDIERNLRISIYEDFIKLYKFANEEQRKFLKLYFMKFEVYTLKYFFRIIFDHRKYQLNSVVVKKLFENHSVLDLEKLAGAENVEELIKMLKGTSYYKILSHLVPVNKELSLYDYETSLDMFYFSTVWKQKSKLKDKSGEKIISKTLGRRLDLLNLQWIYRSKKYYKLKPEQIYGLLIPVGYIIKAEELNTFVMAENLEVFDELLSMTKYAKEDIGIPFIGDKLDNYYYDYMDRLHRKTIRQEPYSMSILDSYLESKEDEIRKISTVIEGIRYGLPQEKILDYIMNNKKNSS